MQHRLETLGPGAMGHAAMGHATPINAVDERTVGAVRPAKAPKGRKKDTSAMGNMMQYNP